MPFEDLAWPSYKVSKTFQQVLFSLLLTSIRRYAKMQNKYIFKLRLEIAKLHGSLITRG